MSADPTRILLVEDNPSDRKFMDACLQDAGVSMELHHAGGLEEASSYLRQRRFELVIADLNLPDTEGLETFFKVKELASDAAIVVMTGVDDPKWATRAMLAGAQDYLVKGDLTPHRVWQIVSNAMQRHVLFRRISGEAHDLRKKNDSLRDQAYIDPLTGLYNRRGLAKFLAQESAQRSKILCSHALLVNVDDFKAINDLFGYNLGDVVLKDIGRRIRVLLRSADIGARVGGDEFLVLTAASDAADATDLAEIIRASTANSGIDADGTSLRPTVSVGVAALARHPYRVEDLIDLARGALTMSKGSGKNRVCVDSQMSSDHADISVIHHPFFEIRNGQVAGYQFKIPAPVAYPTPASLSVSGVRELLRVARRTGGGLECHLELSHIQIMQLRPEDLTLDGEIDRGRMRLCIPEVPMSPVPSGLLDAVRRLQNAGWAIGLTSLALEAHSWGNLLLLEPSVVTLDPKMVNGVSSDHRRMRLLMRLCKALEGLGTGVVAGGVESHEDMEILDHLGVGYAWGPYFTGGVS